MISVRWPYWMETGKLVLFDISLLCVPLVMICMIFLAFPWQGPQRWMTTGTQSIYEYVCISREARSRSNPHLYVRRRIEDWSMEDLPAAAAVNACLYMHARSLARWRAALRPKKSRCLLLMQSHASRLAESSPAVFLIVARSQITPCIQSQSHFHESSKVVRWIYC
jgi:hypothetical protein